MLSMAQRVGVKVHPIDVLHLTEEDQIILGHFLDYNRQFQNHFFKAGAVYPYPGSSSLPNKPAAIRLSHQLIYRISASDPTTYRYDVYSGKIIGGIEHKNGRFGSMHEIIGVLEPREDKSVFYKGDKQRVAKIQNKATWDKSTKHEDELTARMEELRSKKCVYFKDENGVEKVAIVMRFIPGRDLGALQILDEIEKKAGINTTSTDKRMALCLAASKAVKHVHKNNIVHRDIKGSNLLTKLEDEDINALVIDYGLSTDATDNDGLSELGTPIYASYESWTGEVITQAADIYSLAWLLALTCRADDNPADDEGDAQELAGNCHFTNLFSGINDLSLAHQAQISSLLQRMAVRKPTQRVALDIIIGEFEQIILDRRLAALNDDVSEQVRQVITRANRAGLITREKLEEFAGPRHGIFFSEQTHALKDIIMHGLHTVCSDEYAVAEFVRCLDVVALRGLKSKQQVIEKIDLIITNYLSAFTKLQELYQAASVAFEMPALNTSGASIKYLQQKAALGKIIFRSSMLLNLDAAIMTIDEKVRSTRHLVKLQAKLEPQYKGLVLPLPDLSKPNPATLFGQSLKPPAVVSGEAKAILPFKPK